LVPGIRPGTSLKLFIHVSSSLEPLSVVMCYKHVLMPLLFSALMVSLGTINAFGAADTIAPQVQITFPSSRSTLPAGQITLLGTAIDNAGGSGVKKVEVKIDGGAYKLATPRAPGDWSQWSLVVTITTEGSHSIKARATDNAGKTEMAHYNYNDQYARQHSAYNSGTS